MPAGVGTGRAASLSSGVCLSNSGCAATSSTKRARPPAWAGHTLVVSDHGEALRPGAQPLVCFTRADVTLADAANKQRTDFEDDPPPAELSAVGVLGHMIDALGGCATQAAWAERMAPGAFRLTGARTANLGAHQASIQR